MNNKIKAVIFDWAGTTIDFGCFAPLNVFLDIFKNKGIDVTLEEAREPMGMLKIDHIHAILKMKRISKLWEEKFGREFTKNDVNDLYADFEPSLMKVLAEYSEVLDGVLDACKYLKDNNVKIGSTTGYTKKMMMIVQAEAKKRGYIPDALSTAEDVGRGRPYPYMIFKNMELLDVYPPKAVIKVGDTVSDIKEGVNAGVWSVGVIVGSSVMGLSKVDYDSLSKKDKNKLHEDVKNKFYRAGADFVIKDMRELPILIERINEQLNQGVK